MTQLVIFHHQPKTAGTSLRATIQAEYGRRLIENYEPHSHSVEWYRDFYRRLGWWRRRSVRCVGGHTANYLLPVIPDARAFSLLRDPVDRVVSLFHFIPTLQGPTGSRGVRMATAVREQGWDLADIYRELGGGRAEDSDLHDVFRDFFNGQSRAILGPHVGPQALEYSPADSDAESLDHPLAQQLEEIRTRYYTLGVQDHFDQSVARFARHFGWNPPGPSERRNVGGQRPSLGELPPETRDLIRSYNWLDAELHGRARQELLQESS